MIQAKSETFIHICNKCKNESKIVLWEGEKHPLGFLKCYKCGHTDIMKNVLYENEE